MDQTDYFILKYKKAGVSNRSIAAKTGLTEKQVVQRYANTIEEITMQRQSGYDECCNYWDALCKTYQQLGEMLTGIGTGLGAVMPPEEIRALIADNKEDTIRNLMTNAIVLRPFRAPRPPAILKPKTSTTKP